VTRPPRLGQPVKIYRVGGAVRDELLGHPVADRDWVVVGATPETMIASGFRPVGRDFPVFLHPETREEYALARTERKHGHGYRGFEFFASPDVTLEQDLTRRDLTINAMARAEDGTLIDPFGGETDLRARILRHVSPAFAEDPLRVLRVARFAARFGFAVAPETMKLMRGLVASGELETLAPERVWQEFARGLMEPHPSRVLDVLRRCGALAVLLPEVDGPGGARRGGARLAAALDLAAAKGLPLTVRYALLATVLDANAARSAALRVRNAERISVRLRVPADCRDAARLAARWRPIVDRASELSPAALLDLLLAADALRRPERLDALLAVCAVAAGADSAAGYPPANVVRDALAVVKRVDAATIARRTAAGQRGATEQGAIAKALRAARLAALRTRKEKASVPARSGTRSSASHRRRGASGP
jgi:tRNA nucleotidyltransferase (CCA-adding enzyme)